MPDRRKATSTRAGILRPERLAEHSDLQRMTCSQRLSGWVEHYWCLRTDLADGSRLTSSVLPHPAVNLSVELGEHPRARVGADRVVVTGVATQRFDVELAGTGWVLGIKFRPGGFAAYAGVPAAPLTDRVLPAAQLLPEAVLEPLRALTPTTTPQRAAAVADRALEVGLDLGRTGRTVAAEDHGYQVVLRVIDDLLDRRRVVRVADLPDRHGLSTRQLQRLFLRYVGVSPKWVLARYRIHDALAELDAGYDGPLADLAARHGWYDQAHLGRDFSALVGSSVGAYRDRQRAHSDLTDSAARVGG